LCDDDFDEAYATASNTSLYNYGTIYINDELDACNITNYGNIIGTLSPRAKIYDYSWTHYFINYGNVTGSIYGIDIFQYGFFINYGYVNNIGFDTTTVLNYAILAEVHLTASENVNPALLKIYPGSTNINITQEADLFSNFIEIEGNVTIQILTINAGYVNFKGKNFKKKPKKILI